MRRIKHGFNIKIRQMDALYSHFNPRRAIERYQVLANEPPCRLFDKWKWKIASNYVGVGCELFEYPTMARYLKISENDARYIYNAYKKRYDITERLDRLQHACTIVSRC